MSSSSSVFGGEWQRFEGDVEVVGGEGGEVGAGSDMAGSRGEASVASQGSGVDMERCAGEGRTLCASEGSIERSGRDRRGSGDMIVGPGEVMR